MSEESKNSSVNVALKHEGERRFFAQGANFSHHFDTKVSSPKEMFLAGLLGCSAHDVVMFSGRDGFAISDFVLKVEATPEQNPCRFSKLFLVYELCSFAPKESVIDWVESSINTYCTTINTIKGGASMSYSIIYNGEKIVSQKEIA